MKVKSHVKLAELALSNLNDIPYGFSTSWFKFGLVIIDSSWHVKTHPHYMQKSLDYIDKKIEKLTSIKQFNAYYSMQLGIVVHYLCDFCCYAHISGKIGNVSKHVKYENQLQKFLFKNCELFANNLCKKNKLSHAKVINSKSIKTLIENTLSDYMTGNHSYSWDIEKAIELTSDICSIIFCLNHNWAGNIDGQYQNIICN